MGELFGSFFFSGHSISQEEGYRNLLATVPLNCLGVVETVFCGCTNEPAQILLSHDNSLLDNPDRTYADYAKHFYFRCEYCLQVEVVETLSSGSVDVNNFGAHKKLQRQSNVSVGCKIHPYARAVAARYYRPKSHSSIDERLCSDANYFGEIFLFSFF